MIEKILIELGLGCGTVNNFQIALLKASNLGENPKWYFKTPVKISGSGLKSATLDLAFPFDVAVDGESESEALTRLELVRKSYEDDLLFALRKNKIIVPPDTANFTVIPFWADSANYRKELEDFGGVRIHIINAVLTVKYRESWFC